MNRNESEAELVVPGEPIDLELVWEGPIGSRNRRAVRVVDPNRIQTLVQELNGLERVVAKTVIGRRDDGSRVVAIFSYADAKSREVEIRRSGNRFVGVRGLDSWHGTRQLDDYLVALSAAAD